MNLFFHRFYSISSAVILLFAGGIQPLFAKEVPVLQAEDRTSPIISFESGELPGSLNPKGGSQVALSSLHFINGTQSLEWNWNGSSELVFSRPIPYVSKKAAYGELKKSAMSVFSFWVYSEKALPEATLHVGFSRGSNEDCGFDFGLNFTGWRTCSVAFDRDMTGTPVEGMDCLRITAPQNIKQGRLFLDRIILSAVDDIRYQWPDPQVPFVKGTDYTPFELTPVAVADKGAVSQEDSAAVDMLERRFEKSLLLPDPVPGATVDLIKKQFDDLGITLQDGIIRGRHVLIMRGALRDRQDSVYPRKMTAQDDCLMEQYVDLREYTDLLQRIAQAYRSLPPSSADALRLRDLFMLMIRHLLDQGWQDGSALYTTHHFGYASRGWYIAVFLMRDEMQKEGLLEPTVRALIWYMREKVDFAKMEFNETEGTDLDYLNTIAKSHLMTVLSMPDGSSKTVMVKKFSRYLSDLLAADTPGTVGGIKVDGTAFHHGGNYPGYSFPAFGSSAELCRLLTGTPMAVRPDARKNLKKAMRAAAIYCNPETGIGLCGRHPFGESSVFGLREAFLDLALAGDPDTGESVDRALAAEYLRLFPSDQSKCKELFGTDITPSVLPEGHWSFNYGCFGIHRWNGKMVTLKGFNKYVWSSEIYVSDNRYGRYQSNGGIQIMGPEGRNASGMKEAGWDWNRNPGATEIHLPLEQLESPNKNTLMYRSDVRFSGSSRLLNRYGIFAAQLQQPSLERFDPSFTARKSMFCFDNRIVCLGSGIQNKTANFPTETVLFQQAWEKGRTPVWMNSTNAVSEFPVEKNFSGTGWLVDAHGNGYYIAGGNPVRLSLANQNSRQNKTKSQTKGDFASAWIDHGNAPQNASYEYAILLDGTPEKMTAFAQGMNNPAAASYRVLRHDDSAHIVKDRESGVTGYALFEPYSGGSDELLLKTGKPCLIMAQPVPAGKGIRISVNDADLKIVGDMGYATASPCLERPIQVVLRGSWKPAQADQKVSAELRDGNTVLSVMQQHGIPVEFNLIPVE